MALVWTLDRAQVGRDGYIGLYRGDDWRLTGKLVNRVGGVDEDVDSTTYAVSGFFPAQAGGMLLVGGGTLPAGNVVLMANPALTDLTQLNSSGFAPYLVVSDSMSKITTVPSENENVVILDRGSYY